MPGMKKISNGKEDSKKKMRHIVSWTQQEDDILREQVRVHGTEEKWVKIASKFKNKTPRQCKRRWCTYLNSDFKKGGWSPEEDKLLCEAQRILGNRWTEIAKVVSGRTDNAVKNRFTTLCKRRAKYEAFSKEKATSFINLDKKIFLAHDGFSKDGSLESAVRIERIRRTDMSDIMENWNLEDRSHKQFGTTMNQRVRAPFAELNQNFQSVNDVEILNDDQSNRSQGTFLKRDDPAITALTQRAELLSTLAIWINAENSEQSPKNAWKVFQDYLNRSKENDNLKYRFPDRQCRDDKVPVEDPSSNDDSGLWRQADVHESLGSSEYSTVSTLLSNTIKGLTDHHDITMECKLTNAGERDGVGECQKQTICGTTKKQEGGLQCCDEQTNNVAVPSSISSMEFSSPMQVTPVFRSFAAGIPSPQFSESERNFLLKTFGLKSPSPLHNPCAKQQPSQPPPCKRALLQSL